MSYTMNATPEVAEFNREEIEDFLYYEAELLDNWQLDEWFALFDSNAIYEVPAAGQPDDVSSISSLFYIADDYQRLGYRITRLKSKGAHSEWPRSTLSPAANRLLVLQKRARNALLYPSAAQAEPVYRASIPKLA